MSSNPEGPQTAGERADKLSEIRARLEAAALPWSASSAPSARAAFKRYAMSDVSYLLEECDRMQREIERLKAMHGVPTNGSPTKGMNVEMIRPQGYCASRCKSPHYLCELNEGHAGNHAAFVEPERGPRVEWLDGAALSSPARGEPTESENWYQGSTKNDQTQEPQTREPVNKQRRRDLDQITTELTDIQSRLEAIRDDELEAYETMPESLQGSQRGQESQNAGEALGNACDDLATCLTSIDEALQA